MSEISFDIFLTLIKNFFEEHNENKISKKIDKKINHHIEIKEKYKKKFDLNKMIKFYLKNNEDLNSYLEKITKKIIQNENSENEDENENLSLKKKRNKSKAEDCKNRKESNEIEIDFDTKKIAEKYNISLEEVKIEKVKKPFSRIDAEKYSQDNSILANNSYDNYALHTGNVGAIEANNRLKTVVGKDFKKEKNKFKNKSGFGNSKITLDVKSTKLDFDSD
jgi:hypothetical protein